MLMMFTKILKKVKMKKNSVKNQLKNQAKSKCAIWINEEMHFHTIFLHDRTEMQLFFAHKFFQGQTV